MNRFLILLIFLTGMSLSAQQVTYAGLRITSTTTWRGTIIIEGDVVVEPHALLKIEPGTRIYFKPNTDKTRGGVDKTRSELIVKGVLSVKGNAQNMVLFSSATQEPRMGDWYGIRLLNPKETSLINYAQVEYAYNGISIKKSNPRIAHCQLRLNYNAGISVEIKARPKINNTLISENGYAGVITALGARPVFHKCIISLNQIGVITFSLSQPNFGDLEKGPANTTGQNEIFGNEEYDIYNHSNKTIKAENNAWGDAGVADLDKHIFDGRDDSRYGVVDFEPVLGAREQQRPDILQLAGNSPAPAAVTPSGNKPETSATNKPAGNPTRTVFTPVTRKPVAKPELNVPNIADEEKPPPNKEETHREVADATPSETPVENNNETDQSDEEPVQPAIDYDQPFVELVLDSRKSEIIKKVAPVITSDAPRASGRVIVRALVDKTGRVAEASVVRSLNPYHDRLALNAAKKFRYKVGTVKGVPVRFYTNIVFRFE